MDFFAENLETRYQRKHTILQFKRPFYQHKCLRLRGNKCTFAGIANFIPKQKKMEEFFRPEIASSQPCEDFFRQIRSLTSTFSTVTNCSVQGILHRISRIQLMNEITCINLPHFSFPRLNQEHTTLYPSVDRNGKQVESCSILPGTQEIISEIELARMEAIEYAQSLGIVLSTFEDLNCDVSNLSKGTGTNQRNNLDESEQQANTCGVDDETNDPDIMPTFEDVRLNKYNLKKVNPAEIDANRIFVKVKNRQGEISCIFKQTLCWLLSTSTSKLSSDRLLRVMSAKRKEIP